MSRYGRGEPNEPGGKHRGRPIGIGVVCQSHDGGSQHTQSFGDRRRRAQVRLTKRLHGESRLSGGASLLRRRHACHAYIRGGFRRLRLIRRLRLGSLVASRVRDRAVASHRHAPRVHDQRAGRRGDAFRVHRARTPVRMVVRQMARRALRQSASLSAPRRARPAPAPAVGGGRRGGARRRRPRGTRADAPEGSTRPRPEDRPRGGRRRRRRVADRPRQSRRGRRDARARRGAAETRHRPRRASAASSRVVLRARWPTPERRPPPHRAASVRGASRHPRRSHRAIRLRRARDLAHFFFISWRLARSPVRSRSVLRRQKAKRNPKPTRAKRRRSPKTNKQFLAFLATLDRGVSAAARGRRKSHAPARFRVI